MNTNELYHYGIPGMRWGVRRAKNQLSKLTGRDKTKISDKEAKQFRKDTNMIKKLNKSEQSSISKTNLKTQHGKKYADAVVKQAGKERVYDTIAKTALITTGLAIFGSVVKDLGREKISRVCY